MKTSLFIFAFTLSVIVSLSKSETAIEKIDGTKSDAVDQSIQYNLIKDEITEPNNFQISYEVTYGEVIFKRSEKCHIVEKNDTLAGSGELSCSGRTNFTRNGVAKNVSNFDNYNYSSNGFNHTGETFKVSDNVFRLREIDLIYGLQAEPITLKQNSTPAVRKLQFDHIGKDNLTVNFSINSTFFAINRTELFSVVSDEETGTNDLLCVGEVKVVVRNSEDYHTIQTEDFTLGEFYSFVYANVAEFFNVNDSSDNPYNSTDIAFLL